MGLIGNLHHPTEYLHTSSPTVCPRPSVTITVLRVYPPPPPLLTCCDQGSAQTRGCYVTGWSSAQKRSRQLIETYSMHVNKGARARAYADYESI